MVLVELFVVALLLPEPGGPATFRIAAYGFSLAWYATLALLLLGVAQWQARPLRELLLPALGAFVLVMVLNLLSVPVASDLAKVAFASLVGVAVVRFVERPWWLLTICLCVPVADAWSVFSDRGVTNAIVERAEEDPVWIEWPTIAVPIGGLDYDLFPRIGIVDVLFAALFVAAAVRWQLGLVRAAVGVAVGFLATSALLFEGADIAIPALPLLCLAFVVSCWGGLVADARAALAER